LEGLIVYEGKKQLPSRKVSENHYFMSINDLSRCTGFLPDVLRGFAAQGLLSLANPTPGNNE
jgi:hypothetical protein